MCQSKKQKVHGIEEEWLSDVQSGKTSNYVGLINKATDAGYKVVIAGTISSLRRQTQKE
jgi:hypothetical protein